MNFFKNKWIVIAFRLFLGGLLIYASFDKIENPEAFAKIIRNYHAFPYAATNILALLLPWIELYTGVCLIFGILVDGASLLTMAMMGVFILAISQAVLRGIDIECGCFKVTEGSSRVGMRRIIEDIIYLGMAFVVWKREVKVGEWLPKFL